MQIDRVKFRALLGAALIYGTLVTPKFAMADAYPVPGSADPSRALESFQLPMKKQEGIEAPTPPRQAVAEAPPGMENLKFVLNDLSVLDMQAYKPEDLLPIYSEYLGKEISVATVFKIMAAVQQKYLDDGYALTKVVIPNQNIQEGHVQLGVIEGHVGEVEIEGDVRPSAVLADAARQIKEMRPLNVKKLERIMLVTNDLPDLNVSAILAKTQNPEEHPPGTVRLVIKKNPEREERGSIEVNDHGSVFTGPLQTQATMRAFHIGPNYSELQAGGLVSMPVQEQRSAFANYNIPILGVSGTKASFSVSHSATEPGSSLSVLDIKGSSSSVGAEISYPIIRERDKTLKVDAGVEFKNARTKILGEELYDDRVRVVKAGVNYNFTDTWAGYTMMDMHAYKGFNILGARESGSENLSREDGRSDFHKFQFVIGRIQALPANFEVYAVANGQYTRDPLLSSEEFGFGGGQLGRGYDPSEITGDKGVSASLELRYRKVVEIAKKPVEVQPYAFYDVGKVWNIDPDAKDKVSAMSAGAGLRLNINSEWDADLNFAVPLTRSADNEPKYQNDVGSRVLFSLTKRF